jgi:uncharacterized coiled-coil DUF342 family protein
VQSAIGQSKQEMGSNFQLIREEGATNLFSSRQDTKVDLDQFKDGMESLREGIKQLTEEFVSIKEKMREGFVETKEELGSMIRFSYADLEKKFNALEARIKALEKMVFP